jgi:hypothetical protein
MKDLLSNDTFIFYALLAICLVVMYIPVIGKYIRVLETMVHESGHVLMALLTGTKISKINLFSDTSGETHIVTVGKIKTMLVAWMGYPFSSAMAWLSFWAVSSNYKQIFIIVLCLVICIFLIAYIRNGFGIFWAISFILINGYLLYKKQTVVLDILATIYADILFLSSLFSCFIILYLSFKCPDRAGDATEISKVTHIPPQIIAIIFVILCGMISFSTLQKFFPLFNHLELF